MKWCLIFVLSIAFVLPVRAEEERNGAVLQATLSVYPSSQRYDVPIENYGKIQPGTAMKLTAIVKNVGSKSNAAAKMFVRFIFPEPLSNQPNSLLFQTESINVPSITPGQEVVLTFNTSQSWPSLFDFIRYDWGMRQYQAIFVGDDVENVLGTLSIVFSAYYYEGPTKKIATQVPPEIPTVKLSQSDEQKPSPTVTRNVRRPRRGKRFSRQISNMEQTNPAEQSSS